MTQNFSISQNFLSNPELVKKLIKVSELPALDTILDIGVGKGIISAQLIDLGYKVLGFEIDPNLTANLSPEIINNSLFQLKQTDFLSENLNNKTDLSVFSNIPYSQTTKISQKLLIENPIFNRVCLIVQEESAHRLQGINEGLLLSLIIFNNYDSKILYKFKKSDFLPKPRVNSVLIEFIKRDKPLVVKEKFENFLDFICFVIMQQKPSINDRLAGLITTREKEIFLNLIRLDGRLSLYQIDKLKYFEMFKIFLDKFPKHTSIKGYYKKYQAINSRNQKVYRTSLR